MDFDEFAAIHDEYARQRDFDYKDAWERMRLMATLVVQPHLTKSIKAKDLLSLPWDKEERNEKEEQHRTAAEQRARTAELMRRIGKEIK